MWAGVTAASSPELHELARWMMVPGLLSGLLPGTLMLTFALLDRAEERPRLGWAAALAAIVFIACLLLLFFAWITPPGGMVG